MTSLQQELSLEGSRSQSSATLWTEKINMYTLLFPYITHFKITVPVDKPYRWGLDYMFVLPLTGMLGEFFWLLPGGGVGWAEIYKVANSQNIARVLKNGWAARKYDEYLRYSQPCLLTINLYPSCLLKLTNDKSSALR